MAENLLESCETCYQIKLSSCVDKIFIDAGLATLAPDAHYFYRVTDKFGNKFSGTLKYETGDGASLLPYLDVADLPSGLFTPDAGAFKLEIMLANNSCEVETLTLCGVDYDCVLMTFETVFSDEDLTKQTIPCNCP